MGHVHSSAGDGPSEGSAGAYRAPVRPMDAIADLLLPVRCPACPRPACPAPAALCARCDAAATTLALPDLGAAELADGVIAVGGYAYAGVVRDAIRGMKVGGRWAAAPELGRRVLARVGPLPPAAAVTWVPSTRRRVRERGMDLPRLLAGPRAVALLEKVEERPDQTALDPAARRRSPRGAFRATGPVPGSVVLVDDVRTTGGTAVAAGLALHAAGAHRVLVVTLAVGGDDARATTG